MAECSQEFEALLLAHESECFDDWVLNIRCPECGCARDAILQYVARLEASHRARITLGYGSTAGGAV